MRLIGKKIERLHIRDLIGEGGMGSVYLAYDEKLQRNVVVKSMRPDRIDALSRARFLREARALSRLDHDHVCRIYDYLEWEGEVFLVLEHIDGVNLQKAMKKKLTARAQLLIAEQIAEALVFAHANEVVHRDLKLTNVMLTHENEVKVVDFGLAMLSANDFASKSEEVHLQQDKTETQFGSVVGTLRSISPEQARGEAVTAASDMYSFGLMMQELFTGEPPFDQKENAVAILEKAKRAQTRPIKGLDGELTDLFNRLKSLLPESRPTAVDTLAFLKRVRSRPVRRLRAAAAILFVVLSMTAFAKYTYDLNKQRLAAVHAQQEAEQVTEFLIDLFELSDPDEAKGNTITAREILDRGAEKLESELETQPRSRIRLMMTIGEVYQKIGLYSSSNEMLSRAMSECTNLHLQESLIGVKTANRKASLHATLGENEPAMKLYEQAVTWSQQLNPTDYAEFSRGLNGMASVYFSLGAYDDAERLYRQALAVRENHFGKDHPETAESLDDLGYLCWTLGRYSDAEPFYAAALAIRKKQLGPDHPSVAITQYNLALLYRSEGRLDEAEQNYLQVLRIEKKTLGEHHRNVAATLNSLGVLYWHQEKYAQAEPLFRQSLAILTGALGDQHFDLISPLNNLGLLAWKSGDYQEAVDFFDRALKISSDSLGEEHVNVAWPLWGLANVYRDSGDFNKAEQFYQRALAIRKEHLEPDHPQIIETNTEYARLLKLMGRNSEANQLLLNHERGVALQTDVVQEPD